MTNVDQTVVLKKYLPPLLVLATLFITPWMASDPINTPKFLILSVLGAICLCTIVLDIKVFFMSPIYKLISFTSIFFLVAVTLSFIFSDLNWKLQIYGVSGRHTGLITYSSLIYIFASLSILFNQELAKRVLLSFQIVGVISLLYGYLQSFGFDPIKWSNDYNPVIGFMGNPNFQSSLIGIFSVLLMYYVLDRESKAWKQIIYGIMNVFSIILIVRSDSQQGILVYALGGTVIILGRLYGNFKRIYFYVGTSFSTCLGLLAILGMLNQGPLATLIYKSSVTFRGDYWRAGIQMFIEKPLTGFGLDAYGSYYREFRDLSAVTRRGSAITSDAAHNVLIDLLSNGGIFLLLSYLILIVITLVLFLKAVRLRTNNSNLLVLFFALWLAYQAQSIISINQIALALWGWVFMGLTVGMSVFILQNTSDDKPRKFKVTKVNQAAGSSPQTLLLLFVFSLIGFLIGIGPFNASSRQKSAVESGNADKVVSAAYVFPHDPARMVVLASVLANYGFPQDSLKVANDVTKEFPRNFDAWRIISLLPTSSAAEKETALRQMKRLDPLNPDLK